VAHPKATLAEIEQAVDEQITRLRAQMIEQAAQASAAATSEVNQRLVCEQCGQLCWLLVTSIQKIGISAKNITKEQPSRTGSRSHLPKREHLSSSGPSCFAASSARKAKL